MRALTFVLAGFLVAAASLGCSSDSTSSKDATTSDGPGSGRDAAADAAPPPKNDDAAADQLVRDTNERDSRGDVGAPDLAPPDLNVYEHTPQPDLVAVEARPAETQGPDLRDAVAGDGAKPGADVGPDERIADATGAGAETSGASCKLDGAAALTRLKPVELKALLDGGEDPFLINVKGASIGEIPGTDAVLVNNIPGIEALVGGDPCANIILYCQSGNTSQSVASQLIAKGYVHVRDLEGGITAWKNANYPTE